MGIGSKWVKISSCNDLTAALLLLSSSATNGSVSQPVLTTSAMHLLVDVRNEKLSSNCSCMCYHKLHDYKSHAKLSLKYAYPC